MITQQARILGKCLPIFFCQISAKNYEIWLKIDEIGPNSASQEFTLLTVVSFRYFKILVEVTSDWQFGLCCVGSHRKQNEKSRLDAIYYRVAIKRWVKFDKNGYALADKRKYLGAVLQL